MNPHVKLSLEELGFVEPEKKTYERTPFGKEMRKHFMFAPSYRNLNHGSFGTVPRDIFNYANALREQAESRPDPFIRQSYPQLLDRSRAAIAEVLNVHKDTCVFVPNATTGVNTVLRNLKWAADGKDEIIQFSTIYGACGRTIAHVVESSRGLVSTRVLTPIYPISTADHVQLLKDGIAASRAAGKNPRIVLFDAVSSVPGCRIPFEALAAAAKEAGVLSLIDAAHGAGHLPIDLSAVDPDFFVSNCHKWMFAPRGCAVFYVPVRNQHHIRSTIPTSWGFVPESVGSEGSEARNPMKRNDSTAFVGNFQFTGTTDTTPYLCVGEAIRWRKEVCGGEQAIYEYCRDLARRGGGRVAEILGTEVLENAEGDLTDNVMVVVRLPISVDESDEVKAAEEKTRISTFLDETLITEFQTFMAITWWQGAFRVRLSAQVYLDDEDFEWAGQVLKDVCQRVQGKAAEKTEPDLDSLKIVE
jgi:selenocysteine lyase/cysteine desulfurase